jgi:DNA repair and recombination protein RAD54B
MARIWRDGQTRPCHIYRLLVTGLIDEKIFQRQLYKGGLSGVVGNDSTAGLLRGKAADASKAKGASFSRDELRKLFSINEETDCDTRDNIVAGSEMCAAEWKDCKHDTEDAIAQAAVQGASVSFLWLQSVRGQSAETEEETPEHADEPMQKDASLSADEANGASENNPDEMYGCEARQAEECPDDAAVGSDTDCRSTSGLDDSSPSHVPSDGACANGSHQHAEQNCLDDLEVDD